MALPTSGGIRSLPGTSVSGKMPKEVGVWEYISINPTLSASSQKALGPHPPPELGYKAGEFPDGRLPWESFLMLTCLGLDQVCFTHRPFKPSLLPHYKRVPQNVKTRAPRPEPEDVGV